MDVKLKRLIKDLNNSDDDLRALSAMTLMKLDYPEKEIRQTVLNELISSTQDDNVAVRFFARKAIDKIRKTEKLLKTGESSAVPIDERLSSDNFRDRVNAVMDIKNNNLSEYKDKLIGMLSSEEHAFVRASVISALKLFISKEEAEILSPYLTDSDNRVRSNTIEAIEYVKAESAIPALFSALSDPDNRIRAVAAKALQAFGEEKVFIELRKMLESPEEWMKVSAIYALSHIQAAESLKMLMETARKAANPDTRVKAIIALANYNDSATYTFLRGMEASADGVYKETASKALKLFEEKFGTEVPEKTLLDSPENNAEVSEPQEVKPNEAQKTDLASSITNFFRKGKEEAIEFSNKAALNFSITDTKKELDEHLKTVGNTVYEMYQAGELELIEMISTGNEIMKMNFFVQKYTEQEAKEAEAKANGGFLAQIKKLFMPAQENSNSSEKVKKFTKRRDDLIVKLGRIAMKKYEKGDFTSEAMEKPYSVYHRLERKLEEQQRLLEPNAETAEKEAK